MFKGMNIEKFNKYFNNDDDCKNYLYQIKWKNGYVCKKCGGKRHGKGHSSFDTRCFRCHHIESVTANTLFHKIKFPLLKAFGIVFRFAISKNGVSSIEISKTFQINQKTAWLFLHKIRIAVGFNEIETRKKGIKEEHTFIDSVILSQKGSAKNGLQRIYIESIKLTKYNNQRNPPGMMLYKIRNDKKKYNCLLERGRFICQGKDIRLWNFKSWLIGTHHHCSKEFLQAYLDEFLFKINFGKNKECFWHNIIQRMVSSQTNSHQGKGTKLDNRRYPVSSKKANTLE